LTDDGIRGTQLFVKHNLFDHLADQSRVPDETLVPWHQELYYQVVTAACGVNDPYTGASLYFTPHCFRHSFATALAPLIGGNAKTGVESRRAARRNCPVRTVMDAPSAVSPRSERAAAAISPGAIDTLPPRRCRKVHAR
jgi:hypothetical protein